MCANHPFDFDPITLVFGVGGTRLFSAVNLSSSGLTLLSRTLGLNRPRHDQPCNISVGAVGRLQFVDELLHLVSGERR